MKYTIVKDWKKRFPEDTNACHKEDIKEWLKSYDGKGFKGYYDNDGDLRDNGTMVFPPEIVALYPEKKCKKGLSKTDYLLTCLMEEASEVQKEAAKALRFGLNDTNPVTGTRNADAILDEIIDLGVILYMLQEMGNIPEGRVGDADKFDKKYVKVKKWMKYSKKKGRLKNDSHL